MAGISSKASEPGSAENKYKFNGGNELQSKEFSDGSGLELYDATFRMYDAQIGRFHQIDPLGELMEEWSPYNFALNNPILLNDPFGLEPDSTKPQAPNTNDVPLMEPVVVTATKKDCKTCGPSQAKNPPGYIPPAQIPTTPPPGTVVPPPAEPVPPPQVNPVSKDLFRAAGRAGGVLVATFWPMSGPQFPGDDEMHWIRRGPVYNPFPRVAPPFNENNQEITLYRGVYAGHPDIGNARLGRAVPWGLNGGHNNPLMHNLGDNYSIFTSWSVFKSVAASLAGRKGWGGVILTKRFKRWQVVLSPDKFNQGEVLIPGIVNGAKVENARPSNN